MKTQQDYLGQYQRLHDAVEGYLDQGKKQKPYNDLFNGRNFVTKLFTEFQTLVNLRFGESVRVLDYGCGKAKHLHVPSFENDTKNLYEMFPGLIQTYYCFDPGYTKFKTPPPADAKFDIVICADVMEHVANRDQINHVLHTISNHLEWDGVALFTISGKPAKKQFLDGDNLHCSLYSFEQWVEWLEDAFVGKSVLLKYEGEHDEQVWYNAGGFARPL